MTTFEIIGTPSVIGKSTFFTYKKTVKILGITVSTIEVNSEALYCDWYRRFTLVDLVTGKEHCHYLSQSYKALTSQLRSLGFMGVN